ncbi:MAG: NTP transferase domain-containing protein [Methanobrevibacter sp.]|jgi:molybdenum cofactor cytidylyltransferase|nr:NTP transferase domain-containing protein [Methanobrevibacter sp.]
MVKFTGIITAAGKSSRMMEDMKYMGLPVTNKLTLKFDNNKTIIETTINNVLNAGVDECIIVLGHFKDEIIKEVLKINDDRIKIVYNNPIDVPLSISLYNGLMKARSNYILAVAGDQSNISTKTYTHLINTFLNKVNDEDKILTVLRRREIGELYSAEGLGMPFVTNKDYLIKYMENKNTNLNPILREMFNDGFKFFAVKEKNKLELLNINKYNDYKTFLR